MRCNDAIINSRERTAEGGGGPNGPCVRRAKFRARLFRGGLFPFPSLVVSLFVRAVALSTIVQRAPSRGDREYYIASRSRLLITKITNYNFDNEPIILIGRYSLFALNHVLFGFDSSYPTLIDTRANNLNDSTKVARLRPRERARETSIRESRSHPRHSIARRRSSSDIESRARARRNYSLQRVARGALVKASPVNLTRICTTCLFPFLSLRSPLSPCVVLHHLIVSLRANPTLRITSRIIIREREPPAALYRPFSAGYMETWSVRTRNEGDPSLGLASLLSAPT